MYATRKFVSDLTKNFCQLWLFDIIVGMLERVVLLSSWGVKNKKASLGFQNCFIKVSVVLDNEQIFQFSTNIIGYLKSKLPPLNTEGSYSFNLFRKTVRWGNFGLNFLKLFEKIIVNFQIFVKMSGYWYV